MPTRLQHRRKGLARRRLDARGFTLLELLLATAIGAVVLLAINATFFAALRLHDTTHARVDEDLVVQRALGIIRKDLAGILVPGNAQSTANQFRGQLTSDSFTLNAIDSTGERVSPDIYTNSGVVDGWTSYADVQTVAFYLTPATDGTPTKNLVRVVTRNLLPAAEQVTDDQVLLGGVVSAGMSFFDGENWLDTWDSTATNSLPTAIKFSLLRVGRDGSAPRMDTPAIELIVPVIVRTTTTAQQEAAAAAATGQ